jgi:hypothetical protein
MLRVVARLFQERSVWMAAGLLPVASDLQQPAMTRLIQRQPATRQILLRPLPCLIRLDNRNPTQQATRRILRCARSCLSP